MLHTPVSANFPRPHASGLRPEPAKLHVCTMVSNPVRYASRPQLFEKFRAQNEGEHIVHWTVEIAYGKRPFSVTQRDNRHHLQIRTSHEIWHKENALNLLFAHVLSEDPDAEYFAWVDADVTFARPDWAYETIQQLQHFDVVQMFSHAQDVGPKCEPIGKQPAKGFVWSYYNEPAFMRSPARFGYSVDGHPGYAWAARRSALDAFGGLIDFAICGGADRHMACGLIGTIERSTPTITKTIDELAPNFRAGLYLWQERALALQKNVGYVDGLLNHHWHGKKKDRKYGDRWRVYTENGYDPLRHLCRDSQGLYQLTGTAKLRDDLRSYFRARNEDSIDQ